MRALLVGCGAMAAGWTRAVTTNPLLSDKLQTGKLTLCGLVDRDANVAAQFARAQNLVDIPVFGDLETAIAATSPDCVFDVTPPDVRPAVVTTALKAGLHVLSEKPMAPDMHAARGLCSLAANSGRLFAVTQNRRYKRGVRRIEAFVKSGTLGPLTSLHAEFFMGPHFGGFREEMEHALLLDMAIHHFDAARCMAGEEPLAVLCHETNPQGSWYAHGASAAAIFEMSGGVTFTYSGSWCAEGTPTSWDASWRLVGTKGMLTWDGEDALCATLATGEPAFLRETRTVEVPELKDDRRVQEHASVIADFLQAVETGTAPETVCTDNIHSLAMVFGAIDSARSGRRISLTKD
ncbi:Gfo/Idh/MocA family oxidoreductase [Labrenzia sp. OB1]|uniref:Gfo/Idh/MocA family protein n=1 Tax=Labrenzia sp. OB1 TaxID=1561204 RepID=UPI0007B254BC|nr:Gfo/Idh/MocA family oxidoreductase [Labrenzia sp. OB1]KZM47610.1 oxidoreductase [Labrenzia sp. OB1]